VRDRAPDYGLEFLLAFDGRIHRLEEGIKFEIERVNATEERPHSLSYSFTRRDERTGAAESDTHAGEDGVPPVSSR
jgi:hypothetical protein